MGTKECTVVVLSPSALHALKRGSEKASECSGGYKVKRTDFQVGTSDLQDRRRRRKGIRCHPSGGRYKVSCGTKGEDRTRLHLDRSNGVPNLIETPPRCGHFRYCGLGSLGTGVILAEMRICSRMGRSDCCETSGNPLSSSGPSNIALQKIQERVERKRGLLRIASITLVLTRFTQNADADKLIVYPCKGCKH